MKCPNCGAELPSTPRKEWDYNVLHVKMFDCSNCKKTTKAYFRDGALVYTIPKKVFKQ